jgi:alcohol dehydrogenase
MKAVRLEEPKRLERAELEDAPRPAAGEALVRVHRVGICGTDIHGYLGRFPFMKYPRILGHELGVEILETGADVTGLQPGDRCAVEPYINNPASYASRRGASNCCEELNVLGVMVDGGMREAFLVRSDKLHPGNALTYDDLALVETLAIGCHAVDRAALTSHDACLIIGAGPIGLATLVFAQLSGARCIMLDLNEARLQFARTGMGVEHTIGASDSTAAELRQINDGVLPNVIIDATGAKSSIENAFHLLAPTGRLVLLGITTGELTFRHPDFHRIEGTLLCSRNALPKDFRRIIDLIANGKIDTRPWITHRTRLDELPEVFDSYTRPETGVVKAIVEVT